MKKFLFLLLIIVGCCFSSHSQEKLTFSKVIEAKDVDKTSIYFSLRDWISTYYRDTQEVLQMDDKDAGIIIGKAIFLYSMNRPAYSAYDGKIWYSIKLQVKDGRFKAEMSNFVHENEKGNAPACNLGLITTAENYTDKGMQKSFHNKVWKDIKIKSEQESNNIFSDLEKLAASMKPIKEDSDDW
ncbi:DUF4468 domain-containing protein [Coprobacter secundus]|uniref:DUF4468 domain-containing protein n=1 Tax=Coprobacter secundus subsp. similis TaxID=2751153 RepID=A0A7G1HU00_9BACT|nr:DUF4468 domain-containing protein [Coprobacter secundus]BCI62242.1 hypothetical protein Cop2CBH44_05950 [Coprobacter secundus subsp. similis]